MQTGVQPLGTPELRGVVGGDGQSIVCHTLGCNLESALVSAIVGSAASAAVSAIVSALSPLPFASTEPGPTVPSSVPSLISVPESISPDLNTPIYSGPASISVG